MRKLAMIIATLALPMGAVPALADGHMGGEPELANKDWYRVVHIDFKPGKTREALALIKEFIATDRAMDREPAMVVRLNTGPHDVMMMFPMRQGIASMGWASNPQGEAWNKKLEERLGGREKVREHWAKYRSTIANSTSAVAHIDKDYMAGM